ncbi:MAG: hypothetical protein WBA12_04020 [Catalinimonas sp.]
MRNLLRWVSLLVLLTGGRAVGQQHFASLLTEHRRPERVEAVADGSGNTLTYVFENSEHHFWVVTADGRDFHHVFKKESLQWFQELVPTYDAFLAVFYNPKQQNLNVYRIPKEGEAPLPPATVEPLSRREVFVGTVHDGERPYVVAFNEGEGTLLIKKLDEQLRVESRAFELPEAMSERMAEVGAAYVSLGERMTLPAAAPALKVYATGIERFVVTLDEARGTGTPKYVDVDIADLSWREGAVEHRSLKSDYQDRHYVASFVRGGRLFRYRADGKFIAFDVFNLQTLESLRSYVYIDGSKEEIDLVEKATFYSHQLNGRRTDEERVDLRRMWARVGANPVVTVDAAAADKWVVRLGSYDEPEGQATNKGKTEPIKGKTTYYLTALDRTTLSRTAVPVPYDLHRAFANRCGQLEMDQRGNCDAPFAYGDPGQQHLYLSYFLDRGKTRKLETLRISK